jgi:glutamyl-Q tRNA(Asp) synthetase
VIGRFAPSPSGWLHFGSLVAALGSWLDARSRGGRWLLRIDDIDPQRSLPGAADAIRRQLEAHGLCWDGAVHYQSQRRDRYASALGQLRASGLLYACSCSRGSLRGRTRVGPLGPIYPGLCRGRDDPPTAPHTLRFRVPAEPPPFCDGLQPSPPRSLREYVGDVVVWRSDGWPAYHLATALDDARPAITAVVRGADLLWTSPVQIALMRALGLEPPAYRHLPLALADNGQKLSKQSHAPALRDAHAPWQLHRALLFLGQSPPPEMAAAPVAEQLAWALRHWRPERLRGVASRPVSGQRSGPAERP